MTCGLLCLQEVVGGSRSRDVPHVPLMAGLLTGCSGAMGRVMEGPQPCGGAFSCPYHMKDILTVPSSNVGSGRMFVFLTARL